MSNANNAIILLARILLSAIFILSGFGKLADPAGTAGMITQAGMPAATVLAYLAGLFELVTGLAVLIGFQTRLAGWALALFCIFTGVVFHGHAINVPGFPDAANGYLSVMNQIMFMKNITLAGAYILLATYGPGAYSLDARRGAYKPVLA
ncbi:DoxX family protein [Rhizobium paknamense]|uniref:Oxidoreductase n=1 Tax=Rhizobium paknamense TaxID=1206817 RepID=A0ABU0IB78_9HYPH|nr:DoxX family protein [Rhizobium paknamense]MDQ0454957.1 putative oxidoreductase [Rhizobium paknamense]